MIFNCLFDLKIDCFNVEHFILGTKRRFFIYVNFNNGNPREVVFSGAGNGCSTSYFTTIDNNINELNNIVKENK